MKDGDYNTFLGSHTGENCTNIKGSIAIGYGAEPLENNSIAIGSEQCPIKIESDHGNFLHLLINGNPYKIKLYDI